MGFIDYFRYPAERDNWKGPFNGQRERQRIYKELNGLVNFSKIVETGTFRGATTAFFLESSAADILTVESSEKNFGFCQARFLGCRRISLHHSDSRSLLRKFFSSLDANWGQPVFFYLDAHWEQDLPLLEECQIILESKVPSIVMVDDFQVSDDPGYGFDDYGPGKALTLDYLRPIRGLGVEAFFPLAASSEETGKVRGSVILGIGEPCATVLKEVKSLRPVPGWK